MKHLGIISIIVLFIWISFFPSPVQQKYHFITNISLIFVLLIIFVRKRLSFFKLGDYPLWVFLVGIGINVFFASKKNVALNTYLDLAIPMFAVYYIASDSFITDRQFYALAKTICVVSILVAFWGILDFSMRINWLYEYYIPNPYYQECKLIGVMRAMSTQFWSPPLGSYLIASFPFSLLLIRQRRFCLKLLGLSGAILVSMALIVTLSRGAFLGFIAMIIFILLLNKKYWLVLILSIIFCSFALICSYSLNPLNRLGFKQLLYMGSSPIFSNYRFLRILTALQMFKDHPFVGFGFQHFRILFHKYWLKSTIPSQYMIADNMFLTLLVETGILGFSGFVIFIGSIIRKAWRKIIILRYKSSERQQLIIILSAVLGLLINMGAYELFYWRNQYIYFCILIGCLNGLLIKKEEKTN